MRTEFLAGGTGLVVSDGMADAIRRVLAGLGDSLARDLVAAAEDIAAQAETSAPVKTGALKRSIRAFVKVYPDEVRAGVGVGGSSAPHAFYVKWGKAGPGARGKSVWQEALRKPMLARADVLATALGKRIASNLGGG